MTKQSLLAVLCLVGIAASSADVAAQQPPTPTAARPGQTTPRPDIPPPTPSAPGRGSRAAVPQGFSVVLVLGDIQSAASSDDVPLAARKALADMKDFLPFKSYRLLDAAWVMCCGPMAGAERRSVSQNTPAPMLSQQLTQMLRGPDEQEYELKLSSRMENAQVMVRFTLLGSVTASETTISDSAQMRQMGRKLADLKDQAALLEKTIQDTRKKVDVGITSGDNIAKMEVDLRRTNREIEESDHAARRDARRRQAIGARWIGVREPELDHRHQLCDERRRNRGRRHVSPQGRKQGADCAAHRSAPARVHRSPRGAEMFLARRSEGQEFTKSKFLSSLLPLMISLFCIFVAS